MTSEHWKDRRGASDTKSSLYPEKHHPGGVNSQPTILLALLVQLFACSAHIELIRSHIVSKGSSACGNTPYHSGYKSAYLCMAPSQEKQHCLVAESHTSQHTVQAGYNLIFSLPCCPVFNKGFFFFFLLLNDCFFPFLKP